MGSPHSDALVFFGATGDLAYKKIFPALQGMVKRGHLNVPVIGVAKSGWNLDQFRARALDSLEKHGGVESAAFGSRPICSKRSWNNWRNRAVPPEPASSLKNLSDMIFHPHGN